MEHRHGDGEGDSHGYQQDKPHEQEGDRAGMFPWAHSFRSVIAPFPSHRSQPWWFCQCIPSSSSQDTELIPDPPQRWQVSNGMNNHNQRRQGKKEGACHNEGRRETGGVGIECCHGHQ
jgi:hypothetical protein